MDVTLPGIGFLIGVLTGLTSMGGAALMTPFLILVLGVRPVIAVGTDLACSALTKLVGAVIHWRQGTVDMTVVRRLAFGSLPASLLGVTAVALLVRSGIDPDRHVRHALGVVLVVVGALLIGRTVGWLSWHSPAAWIEKQRGVLTVVWGAAAGFAVGLTSVGSGSLIAPMLMALYRLSAAQVAGTSVFHAAILVTVTAVGHAGVGTVDWPLAAGLLAGSVPGVVVGSYLAPRLPAKMLRFGLACVLLASGLKLV